MVIKMYRDPLITKVTNINGNFHCRLYRYDKVYSEMACKFKEDIRLCFHKMLRWYDKMGNSPYSKMADASRNRMKNYEKPAGKIWRIK